MRHRARILSRAAALLAAWFAASAPASGAGQSSSWDVQVTPYVWAFGLDGRVRPGAGLPAVEVDASFSDLLEDVDLALFGMVSARRDDIVLLADASWSNSSRDGKLPPGLPAEGGLRQASLTMLAGRTLGGDERRSFALLGGLRAWSIRARADVPLAGLRASPSLDFADPIVAGRLDWTFDDRWSAFFYGDVGGFGVSSESTWQLVATANYRFDNGLRVSGGYRVLQLDYARGGAFADVELSGPVVGVTLSF